jgi:hypothetical protein
VRLWTLHPGYLDAKGLVALWREPLLAQRVLQGATRGYRQHPQLQRFRQSAEPMAAIGRFLAGVHGEAARRGYAFDASLIVAPELAIEIEATEGQLLFERRHLEEKLARRDPPRLGRLRAGALEPHPLFRVVPGDRAPWERAATAPRSGAERP